MASALGTYPNNETMFIAIVNGGDAHACSQRIGVVLNTDAAKPFAHGSSRVQELLTTPRRVVNSRGAGPRTARRPDWPHAARGRRRLRAYVVKLCLPPP